MPLGPMYVYTYLQVKGNEALLLLLAWVLHLTSGNILAATAVKISTTLVSVLASSPTSACCTFTATGCPFASTAKCTCASEAGVRQERNNGYALLRPFACSVGPHYLLSILLTQDDAVAGTGI